MSKLVRLIAYAVAALAGLSILILIALHLISDDTYKSWMTRAVISTTGRELIIAGDFNLDLGTTMRLEAADVSLVNAEWGSRANMFEVKRIEAEVRLWPLLNGVLDLVLRVDAAKLVLETDASGRGNWEFGLAESIEEPQREATALQLITREIEMTDVRVSFIQGDTHIVHTAELDKVRLRTRNDRLRATLEGRIDDEALTLSANLGTKAKSGTTNARLDGQLGDMSLTAVGMVGQLDDRAGPQLDLALLLKAPHIQSLQILVPSPLPELGPIAVSGRLKGSAGVYAAEDVRAQLSGESTSLLIEGRIGDVMATDGIALRVDASTDVLPEIVEALALDFPMGVPQFMEAGVAVSGNKANLALKDAQLTVRDGDTEAVLVGGMDNLLAQDGLRAQVEANAASLAALSKYVGRELPNTGPLNASATLSSSDGTYELSGLNLSLQGEVMDATVDGSIADLWALKGINMDLKGHIRSLADFSKLLNRKLPETTPLEVSVQFTADDDAAGPGSVIASVKGDWLNADAEGRIDALRGFRDVDIDVSLTLDSLGPIGALLGESVPEMGPVNVSGHIRSLGDAYALTDIKASIEDEELTAHMSGSITDLLAVKGIDMEIDGHIGSLKQLSGLAGRELPDTKPIELHAQVTAVEGPKGAAKVDAVLKGEWIETRINGQIGDLRALKGIDADLLVNAKSLAPVAELAGTSLPDIGPATLSGHVRSAGDAYALTDIKASIEDEQLTAQITGSIADLLAAKGIDVEIDGHIGSLAYFSEFAQTTLPDLGPVNVSGHIEHTGPTYELTDIDANIADENLAAHITGTIADLVAVKGVNLELTSKTPSLARLSDLVNTQLPDTGPFELEATVQAKSGLAQPAELSVRAKSESLSGSIVGSVGDLKALDELDVTLALKASKLEDIGKLAGVNLSQAGPVKANAQLVSSAGHITVDAIEIMIGNSIIDGNLKFVPQTDNPNSKRAMEGRLTSEFIDLNEILGIELTTENKMETEEIPESTTAEEETEATDNQSERLFPDEPLPLDLLRRYTANVAFDTKRLRFRYTDVNDFNGAITLHDGLLRTEVTEARIGDRPAKADIVLDAGVKPVVLALKMNLDKIPLPPISELNAVLQGGELLLSVDVEGQGASMREIMGHLNGQATISIRNARTPNNSLDKFGAGIAVSTINPFEKDKQFTTLHCGASRFDITDGVAQTPRGLALQLTRVTWLGSGKVDFKTEEIDIRATPKARKGLLGAGTLAKMLQLRGTLANPQLVTDPVGLAKSSASVALAFATGGMSLLYEGLYGLIRANVDVCKRIEKEIVEQPAGAAGSN